MGICVSAITAPRGWELVRHAGPLPSHPDEDDLRLGGTRCARWLMRAPASSRREMARHRMAFDDFLPAPERLPGWRSCAARAWGRRWRGRFTGAPPDPAD